ncbi:MAG: hypothetical protein D6675_03510, partial [Gemmatimonadetes bacterium]
GLSVRENVKRIDATHEQIRISRQGQLLGISRSSTYYQPRVDPYELKVMHQLDEIYTEAPFYGSEPLGMSPKALFLCLPVP